MQTANMLKRRIRYLSIASLILGFTVPMMIVLSSHHYSLDINPIVNFARCIKIGFPLGGCILVSFLLILVSAIVVIYFWKQHVYEDPLGRNITYSDTDAYGTARFAWEEEYREIAPVRSFKDCSGLILGQRIDADDEDPDSYIDFHPANAPLFNSNVIVYGASGSGKTSCLVKPAICQFMANRTSIVISDPKGELYVESSEMLRAHGYEVLCFDLINQAKSDGWDPVQTLLRLNPDNLEQAVEVFAAAIVSNISDNQDVYSIAGKSLIKAVLFYVILSDDIKPEKKNMKTFKEILGLGDANEYANRFTNIGNDSKLAPIEKAYNEFKTASEKLYGNIFVHINSGTSTLGSEAISNILCTDDIDMAKPGSKPCAIFCRFAVTNSAYKFIIAMFFSTFFEVLFSEAEHNGGALKIPVNFILDEFANIGMLPDWDKKMSVIRSYNVNAMMILQDETQLTRVYPKMDVTIRANCATLICMGVNDEVSSKLIADRIGEMTQEIRTTHEGEFGKTLDNANVGVGKRMFLSASELQQLDKYHEIIIFQRKRPIIAKKVHISKFSVANDVPHATFDDKPDITDIEGRKKFAQKIEKLKEDYVKKYGKVALEPYDPDANIQTSPTEIAGRSFIGIIFYVYNEDLTYLWSRAKEILKKTSLYNKFFPVEEEGETVTEKAETKNEDSDGHTADIKITTNENDVFFDDWTEDEESSEPETTAEAKTEAEVADPVETPSKEVPDATVKRTSSAAMVKETEAETPKDNKRDTKKADGKPQERTATQSSINTVASIVDSKRTETGDKCEWCSKTITEYEKRASSRYEKQLCANCLDKMKKRMNSNMREKERKEKAGTTQAQQNQRKPISALPTK